jgi:hypothetical protein
MARHDHKEARKNKYNNDNNTSTTTGVIHTHCPTMKWTTTTHRPHLLISPCICRSKTYKACKLALRLRPSRTTKVIARHVTDHLFQIVLQWLSECRAFDSNLEFFVQQKEMMNCLVCTPPPPYYPIVLVRHYLTLEGARNSVNWSVINSKYKSKKNKPTNTLNPWTTITPLILILTMMTFPCPCPLRKLLQQEDHLPELPLLQLQFPLSPQITLVSFVILLNTNTRHRCVSGQLPVPSSLTKDPRPIPCPNTTDSLCLPVLLKISTKSGTRMSKYLYILKVKTSLSPHIPIRTGHP